MFTLAKLIIADININHTDFFTAFKTMVRNRAETRTCYPVLNDVGGPEPIHVLTEDVYSLRSCPGLLGFSKFLQRFLTFCRKE